MLDFSKIWTYAQFSVNFEEIIEKILNLVIVALWGICHTTFLF